MKLLFSCIVVFFGLSLHAQLVFENTSLKTSTPKFIVNPLNKSTQLYLNSGGVTKVAYNWNSVPALYDDSDRINRYKMIIVENDKVAKRTFEIHYSLYRETQGYVGYIKQTIDYHDSRTTKIIENNFKINN